MEREFTHSSSSLASNQLELDPRIHMEIKIEHLLCYWYIKYRKLQNPGVGLNHQVEQDEVEMTIKVIFRDL